MLLGIDIGQSSCKVSALDDNGALISSRQAAYRTAYPRPGWAEQDPDDWVAAAGSACRALLGALPDFEIRAVACTSATHNAVLLDEHGRAVRPCILLSDTRAACDAEAVEHALGGYVLERTRNRATAGWTLPQLRWVAREEPGVWCRVRRVVFAKDFVRRALTGDFVTDWIDAEGSLLFDAGSRAWNDRLCAQVPIPCEALPSVVPPDTIVGTTQDGVFGLPAGVPVVAGCSDTAAEAFAAGANREGVAVVKLATAGNVNVVSRRATPSLSYFTYTHLLANLVYHSFGTNAAALSRAWLQDILGATAPTDYERLDAGISGIAPGAEGLLFHPYLAGERAPVFDTTLRGSLLGLTTAHGRAHIARAVLEGVALSLADCAEVADRHGLAVEEVRIIGGGARSDVWTQIVADALGREVVRPPLSDASAGAALLAGAGVGVLDGLDAAAACTAGGGERFAPARDRSEFYRALLELYRDARDRVAPVSRALHDLAFPEAPQVTPMR